jgi:PiT family inorganic phosphate transporter
MSIPFLVLAVLFLAYANGANDNFKGVAPLFGSNTTTYRTALAWATLTTAAGSLLSILLAETLLRSFSGEGLLPDALVGSPPLLLAMAVGAGGTVMLATITGFPISTTHSLTGALVGCGFAAAGTHLDLTVLREQFALPLLLSPFLAAGVGATLYLVCRFARLRLGITKEWCVCVGATRRLVPLPQPASVLSVQAFPMLRVAADTATRCSEQYAGRFLGISCHRAMDVAHFLSAGIVSLARGLNDTPKIAALLLVADAFEIERGMVLVAVAMAIGGLTNARPVAETMSHRITAMNHGQAFAANVATGFLVIAASRFGLPVSTTHVSVGSLFGIGLVTRQANMRVVGGIVLSWLVTLPCAAALAALAYGLVIGWRVLASMV